MAAAARQGRERPIRDDERSGVLHPQNLRRYDAHWFDPGQSVRDVVDQYWQVGWRLPRGESIDQRIIDLPAVTLTIEDGDVPAPLVATGLQSRAWTRRITGAGSVFAIRLRPAGLAVLSELSARQLADVTVPLTPELDTRLFVFMSGIAAEPTAERRVRAADEAIRAQLDRTPARPELLLANAVMDELTARVRSRAGSSLADEFGVSERTLQRALHATLGRGPKWVSRRIRLQEVARALAAGVPSDLATLAADLGYTDQAHLTRDFRAAAGSSPAAYARALRAIASPPPTGTAT